MSLFPLKTLQWFSNSTQRKSQNLFNDLQRSAPNFPFPRFPCSCSLNSPASTHHLFSEPFPDDPILKLKATPPPQPSPWPNWIDSHHHYPTYNTVICLQLYLPRHSEHKHHDCRIFGLIYYYIPNSYGT